MQAPKKSFRARQHLRKLLGSGGLWSSSAESKLEAVRELADAVRADYVRHKRKMLDPGLWVLAVYRYGRLAKTISWKPARVVADRCYYMASMAVTWTTGSHVPREVELGEATHFVHGLDVRIHPGTKIGNRVGIMHEVTIAATAGRRGAPTIGDDVFIGCGAKILGPVKIGAGAVVAANSLVVTNVPAGTTAVGVPAMIRRIQVKRD